jgi:hypothetical protein
MAINIAPFVYQQRWPTRPNGQIIQTEHLKPLGGIGDIFAAGVQGWQQGQDRTLARQGQQADIEQTRARTRQIATEDPETDRMLKALAIANDRLMYYPDDAGALRIKNWAEQGLMQRIGTVPDVSAPGGGTPSGPQSKAGQLTPEQNFAANAAKVGGFDDATLKATKNAWLQEAAARGVAGSQLAALEAAFDSRDPVKIAAAIRTIIPLRTRSGTPAASGGPSLAGAIGSSMTATAPTPAPSAPIPVRAQRRINPPASPGWGTGPGIAARIMQEIGAGGSTPQGAQIPQANGAAPGVLPRVRNDEDYDKLPSGTEFIDPQGRRRRKP